jgi:hypothetical protein
MVALKWDVSGIVGRSGIGRGDHLIPLRSRCASTIVQSGSESDFARRTPARPLLTQNGHNRRCATAGA